MLRFCSAIGALAAKPVVVTGDYSDSPPKTHAGVALKLDTVRRIRELHARRWLCACDHSRTNSQRPAVLSGADSQPVSALLIAAAFEEGPIELHVHNPGEKAWINVTLDWLKRLGRYV